MTLNLQSSLAVSCGLHLAVALFAGIFTHLTRPVLPSIMEITLVSGPGGGGGGGGAEVRAGTAGRPAPAAAAEVKAAKGGLVSVASPEFVTVGKRPQRTEESLMGADTGGISGPAAGGGGSTVGGGGPGGGGGAGRQLRYQEPLEYPDWAKEQGIDARVVLRFKVLPDGRVDSSVIVRRTSGWRKLDELAIRALRNFLFEPLGPQMPQIPQWGELSFHFKPE